MKKPRVFYLVNHTPEGTAVFSKLTYAKEYAKRYVFLFGTKIIKVQEIINAKTTKDKKPKRPKAARKVQAVAGKRKKEVEKARKEKD